MTDQNSDRPRNAEAWIDSDGNAQLLVLQPTDQPDASPSFVLYGSVCCESGYEDRLSGLRYLTTHEDKSQMRGSVQDGLFVGRFEYRQRRYDFSLARAAAFDSPLTLARVAGVYTQTESSLFGSSTLTLAVDAQGAVTGSHSNGCAYNGRVQIPDPNHNMFRLNIEISGCGGFTSSRSWNGKYEGLGMLKSGGVLYHSLIGSTWFGPQAPVK